MNRAPSQPPPSNRARYSSGTYARAELGDRILDSLGADKPGLASTVRRQGRRRKELSLAQKQSMLRAKASFVQLLEALDMDVREAARIIGVDETTIRRGIDERIFLYNVQDWWVEELGPRAVELAGLIKLRTGTGG